MQRDLIISSQLANIEKVRCFLEEIFTESGLNKSYFNRVFLGISEAVNNSIIHGNCLRVDKRVFIRISFNKNLLSIEVRDEGNGFESDNINDPTCAENVKKESGRGIFLIRNTADEVEFLESGSKVLIKYSIEK